MNIAAVIMAAGRSTRMRSALPKGAHKICGKPMARHIIDTCRGAGADKIIVVVGHEKEKMMAALGDDVTYVEQKEQKGTGHACAQAFPELTEDVGTVLVFPADTPLVDVKTVKDLIKTHKTEDNSVTLLGAYLSDALSYGRIIRGKGTEIKAVVESKDADEETLKIGEFNTSIYAFRRDFLISSVSKLSTNNAQGEYYLTDLIGIAHDEEGERAGLCLMENADDAIGVDDRIRLAAATATMRRRINEAIMAEGVTLIDPATTYIDCDVKIGRDAVIYPCTVIERGAKIAENEVVPPFSRILGETEKQ
ncbi:MAG: NTP transferase domain-containing protein [Abditibacteriota bacterium]|nr:NTP transferase domain-containing protein [Abditibacteriota bacterium]